MHLDLAREPQESSSGLSLPFPPSLSSPFFPWSCSRLPIGPSALGHRTVAWFAGRKARRARGSREGERLAISDRKPDVSKPAQGEDVAPEKTQIFVYATGGTPCTRA